MNKLDFTKPVQTRDGRNVRILCTDAGGACPIVGLFSEMVCRWPLDGRHIYQDYSLINAPQEHELWLNVYHGVMSVAYDSRKQADDNAEKDKRIACLHIKFKEGDGL